jgi:hypothetical protein
MSSIVAVHLIASILEKVEICRFVGLTAEQVRGIEVSQEVPSLAEESSQAGPLPMESGSAPSAPVLRPAFGRLGFGLGLCSAPIGFAHVCIPLVKCDPRLAS